MYPNLFSVGPFTVYSHGVLEVLGFLAAGLVAYWGFKLRKIGTESIMPLVIISAVGGLVGAKLDYLLVNPGDLSGGLFSILSGAGLVWYGGIVGAVIPALIFMRYKRMPVGKVLDAAAPAIAIGLAIGRIGCFLAGTCYGRPSTLPWAVSFPHGMVPTLPGVAVQPTQLYEMLASFAIFGLLIYLAPRLKRDWAAISLYMLLGGIVRFLDELLRFSRDGQLQAEAVALAVAVAGAAAFIWAMKRAVSEPSLMVRQEIA